MIETSTLLLCSALWIHTDDVARGPNRDPTPQTTPSEVLFYDRLHQTFLLMNQVVLPAYAEHFQDDPVSLSIVHHFEGRLAELRGDWRGALKSFHKSCTLVPMNYFYSCLSGERILADERSTEVLGQDELRRIQSMNKWTRMAFQQAPFIEPALAAANRGDTQELSKWLNRGGSSPALVLKRTSGVESSPLTAQCPVYDPELFWAHRRLWELKSGGGPPAEPGRIHDAIAERQLAIRARRERPEDAELSLRKFLDKHRQVIWELGWLYRCLGVELDQAGNAAGSRENYLRAWVIGDSLFPASERGRLDRFDRVFLAEVGDVYARLGRYDLMLRYMYSDQGLPAQYEMTKPIAELARVAESVRLVRHDETASEQLDEALPETVSQILFEQAVMAPVPAANQASTTGASGSSRLGWALVAGGGVVLLGALVWRLSRSTRPSVKLSSSKNVSSLSTME